MPSLTRPLVLTIDLDETFAKSTAEDRAQLMTLFEGEESLRAVYTTHGPAEHLIKLAAEAEMPVPEMFLADTGTTCLKGDGTGTIEPLQRNIIQLWPGKETVVKAMQGIAGVTLVEDDALCRQTVDVAGDESLEAVRAKADEMGCHLEHRVDNRYDVLPYGVDKGSTLGRWFVQENVNPSAVLCFGESDGDIGLFGRGWRGAVFAHAPEYLREEAGRFHNVKILETSGARGVLDALAHFGWMEMTGAA